MEPLIGALVILVLIWSIIFLIIAIWIFIIMRQVKQSLDTVHEILQSAQTFTNKAGDLVDDVKSPLKVAKMAATVFGMFAGATKGRSKK